MRLFEMTVDTGTVQENIPAHEPPKRDEPSKSTPRREASFWFRSVFYRNMWTPLPELIPMVLRASRNSRPYLNPHGGQRPQRGSAVITRVIPRSYSEQISG